MKPGKYAIRSMFCAEPGNVLVAFDLSQAETWVVAHLANERNMMRSLSEGDIHSDTAVALFYPQLAGCEHKWKKNPDESRDCTICNVHITKDQRYLGKKYNHASSYRMSHTRAAEIINKESIDTGVTVTTHQSKMYQERWHGYYGIKHWWHDIEVKLGQSRTLTTVYGFRRQFFGFWGDELFKEATAFEPQSTVADHAFGAVHPELGIPGGIISIYEHFRGTDVRVCHTAHDSVTVECPKPIYKEVAQVCYKYMKRPCVVNGMEFTIPVDGEVGERWGELEGLKKEFLEAA